MMSLLPSEVIPEIIGSMLKTQECSICLELLDHPVSIGCGHFFCRACITELTRANYRVNCPLCKKEFTRRSVQDAPQRCTIVERVKKLAFKCKELIGTKFKQLNEEPSQRNKSTAPSYNSNEKQLQLAPGKKKSPEGVNSINGTKQSYGFRNDSQMQGIEAKSLKVVIPYEENVASSLEQDSDSDDSMPNLPSLEILLNPVKHDELNNLSLSSEQSRKGSIKSKVSISHSLTTIDKNKPELSQKPYIVKTKGCRIHYGEKVENINKSSTQNDAATDPFQYIVSEESPISKKNNKKRKIKWPAEKNLKIKRSAYGKIRVNALKNKTNKDHSDDSDFQYKNTESTKTIKATINTPLVVEGSKENDVHLISTSSIVNENNDNTKLSNDVLPAIVKKSKCNDYKSKSKRSKRGIKRINIALLSSSSAEEEISMWVKKLKEAEKSKLNVEKVDREKKNVKEKVICTLSEKAIPSIQHKNNSLKLSSNAENLDSSVSLQNATSPELAETSKYSLTKSPGWSRLKQLNKDFHLREFSKLAIQTNTLSKSIIERRSTKFDNTNQTSGESRSTEKISKSLNDAKCVIGVKGKLNRTSRNLSLSGCRNNKPSKHVSSSINHKTNEKLLCETALHCDSATKEIIPDPPKITQISELQSSNHSLFGSDDNQISYQTDHENLIIQPESEMRLKNSVSNTVPINSVPNTAKSSLSLKCNRAQEEINLNQESCTLLNSVENSVKSESSSKEIFPSWGTNSDYKSQKGSESAVSANQVEKRICNNEASDSFDPSSSKKYLNSNSPENDVQIEIVECAEKVTEICSVNDGLTDEFKSNMTTDKLLDFHPPMDAVRKIENVGREQWHFHEHSKSNYLRHLNEDEVQYIEHSQQTTQSLLASNNHLILQSDLATSNCNVVPQVSYTKNVPFNCQPFHTFCGNNDVNRKSNGPTERTKVIKRTCLTLEEIQDHFSKSYQSNSTEVICLLPFSSGDYHLQLSVSDETLNVSILKSLSSLTETNSSIRDLINPIQISEIGVQTSDDRVPFSPTTITASSNSELAEHSFISSPKCNVGKDQFPFLSETNVQPTPDVKASPNTVNALELITIEGNCKEKIPSVSSVLQNRTLLAKEVLGDDERIEMFETSSQSSIISNQEIFSSKKESEDKEIISDSPSPLHEKATGHKKEKLKNCTFSSAAVEDNEQSLKIYSQMSLKTKKSSEHDFEKTSSSDEFDPFEKDPFFYRSTPISKSSADLKNMIQGSENLSSDPDMAFATDLVAPLKDMAQKLQCEERESSKLGIQSMQKQSRLSLSRLRRKPLLEEPKLDVFEKNIPKIKPSTQNKFKRIKCMDSSDESDSDKSQSICERKRNSECGKDLEETEETLVIHSDILLDDDNDLNLNSPSAMDKVKKNIQHDLNLVSTNQKEEESTHPDKNSTILSESSVEAPTQIKMEIDELGEHIKLLEEKLKQQCEKETVDETEDELMETASDPRKEDYGEEGFDVEDFDLDDSMYSEEIQTIPPTPPGSTGNPHDTNYNPSFYKRF